MNIGQIVKYVRDRDGVENSNGQQPREYWRVNSGHISLGYQLHQCGHLWHSLWSLKIQPSSWMKLRVRFIKIEIFRLTFWFYHLWWLYFRFQHEHDLDGGGGILHSHHHQVLGPNHVQHHHPGWEHWKHSCHLCGESVELIQWRVESAKKIGKGKMSDRTSFCFW